MASFPVLTDGCAGPGPVGDDRVAEVGRRLEREFAAHPAELVRATCGVCLRSLDPCSPEAVPELLYRLASQRLTELPAALPAEFPTEFPAGPEAGGRTGP
ncbi:hypothetical protein LWF15_16740 [Kineosporia rhizophila]|uniref:hypothetical protein n=1 Tax=Kineosporia rhizophila TaxID=84633 RepID=UPI001E2E5D24|nr:hypothetical protein [Kineosporia rhizophila]MCE0537150.1 hypothetical protein [Kineosporia rhizophila]